MHKLATAIVLCLSAALNVSTALADDWTAVRLRGGVFSLENGAWTQIVKGSVVPDDRVIKSAPGGRVTFVRGAETIEIGPETTAQISDRAGFTTVYNHEGTVGIDAEARNVRHFAVQTPFIAAVVKGTAFTVETSSQGSTVTVARGTVDVEDEQSSNHVSVEAGQQISASADVPLATANVVPAPADAPAPPAPAALQPQVTPAAVDRVSGTNPGSDSGSPNRPGDGGGGGNRPGNSNGPGGNDRPGNGGGPGNGHGSGPGSNGNGPGGGNGNGPGGGGGPGGGNGPGGGGGPGGGNGNGPGSNGNGPGDGNANGPGGSGGPGGGNGNGPGGGDGPGGGNGPGGGHGG